MIAITGVVVLLCVANVHGFNSPSAPGKVARETKQCSYIKKIAKFYLAS